MKIIAGIFVATLLLAGTAHAQLGQVLTPSAMPGTAQSFRQVDAAWTSLASTQADGVVVTQYVNAQDVVFAISWDGPIKPDLRQLLGSYFRVDATLNPIGNVSEQASGDLVVVSRGSMPHFQGHAYLASDMPAGFTFP